MQTESFNRSFKDTISHKRDTRDQSVHLTEFQTKEVPLFKN